MLLYFAHGAEYPELGALLPEDSENALASIYMWFEDELFPLERAKTILNAGFSWNKDYQLYVDPSQTKFIEAMESLCKPSPKSRSPEGPGL